MRVPDQIWIQLPSPSNTTIALLVGGLVGLFALAVGAELWRQRRLRQRRITIEWRDAERIMKDRDLGPHEIELLKEVVQRWSPEHPLKAVTTRAQFNECIESEMRHLSEQGAHQSFEERGAVLRDVRERLALDIVPFGYQLRTTRELYSGQLLNISVSSGSKNVWHPFIVERLDEAYIYARFRDEKEMTTPTFQANETLRCHMWREEDARYTFSLTYVRTDEETGTLLFSHAASIERHQAREHFRIHYDETVTVGILNAPLNRSFDDVHERKPVTRTRGRVTSLSAGGLAAVFQQPLPKQILLRFELGLGSEGPVTVNAEIVATHSISGGRQLVRASFVAIDEESQDTIARFVMHRQQPLLAATPHSDSVAGSAVE